MTEQPIAELRELAVKIATSYTQANPVSVETLSAVIQSAYRGLLACTRPPGPAAVEKTPRGRSTGAGRRRRTA
ncbi:hypothetical protein [Oleisolibacter albus]|uniref:hypothetical protein n=1 Tax=Oleisolibacter albus TaxID=2171757 RepID=UPI000DF1CD29|nr:hypothetical protein [Oleisolibacter albus]